MKIIVCVDERGGLSFAKKRHATDRLLREDMLKTCQNNTLWMGAYSYQQFETDFQSRIALTENYQTPIPEQDYLFVERSPLTSLLSEANTLIIYNWNRHYPSDCYLDVDFSQWHLAETEEFPGFSHPKITKEVWIK